MKAKKVLSNILFTILVALTAFFGLFAACGLKFRIKYSVSIVQQYSMVPTINKSLYLSDPHFDFDNTEFGDVAYVYRWANFKLGDIVIADVKNSGTAETDLIEKPIAKRVVGMPGDKIRITKTEDENGKIIYTLLVNEQPLYTKHQKEYIGKNKYGEEVYLQNANSYANYISFFDKESNSQNIVLSESGNVENDENSYIILHENECFLMGDNWSSSYDSLEFGVVKTNKITGKITYVVNYYSNQFWAVIKLIFKDAFYGSFKNKLAR